MKTSDSGSRRRQWPVADDVVISGISGRFPEADNMDEFSANLYNGIDMITQDDRRWPVGYLGLAPRSGKLKDITRFDAQFFGKTDSEAHLIDPQLRLLLEVTYETICDAGIDPDELRGTRTAVFLGQIYDEVDRANTDPDRVQGYRQFYATMVSEYYDFRGPVAMYDTACASSLCALTDAFAAIKSGTIDQAIIGGICITLASCSSLAFNLLGMGSPDGVSRCLDADANGYVKAETVSTILLQRKGDARRIYATVLNSRTNSDGYKVEGITFPSSVAQHSLMNETYDELSLDPSEVGYVEAHVTATRVGDAIEMAAIERTFCKSDRKQRLLIGCLKSNMGHAEPSAGVAAIAKALLVFETGLIPPNLNFNTVNPKIDCLVNDLVEPVNQITPYDGQYIGVNSFGFGGVNVHTVLQRNDTDSDIDGNYGMSFPRLINVAGPTQESVEATFNYIVDNSDKINSHFLQLLNNVSKSRNKGLRSRGYMVVQENQDGTRSYSRQIRNVSSGSYDRPVWFVFGGINCQWPDLGKDLYEIPACRESLERSAELLELHGLSLRDILIGSNLTLSPGTTIVGIAAIQIALVDLLRDLGLEPDGYVGHSFGEIACAYCDGCLTHQQALTLANVTGQIVELNLRPDLDGIASPFLRQLREIIRSPMKRSSKWISSAFSSTNSSESDRICASAEYFLKTLTGSELFADAIKDVPSNALVVELGPHSLLDPEVKLSPSGEVKQIGLMSRANSNAADIISGIGEIYAAGLNPRIESMYPTVTGCPPRGTPMISSLIRWNHNTKYLVTKYPDYFNFTDSSDYTFTFDLNDPKNTFLMSHCIDGRILFPGTGYLMLAWITLSRVKKIPVTQLPIEFQEVILHRATLMSKSAVSTFVVHYNEGDNSFYIVEAGSVCVSGKIMVKVDCPAVEVEMNELTKDLVILDDKALYKELRVRGYDYGHHFQYVTEAVADGSQGWVKWPDFDVEEDTDNPYQSELKLMSYFIAFADALTHIDGLSRKTRSMILPTKYESATVDPRALFAAIEQRKRSAPDAECVLPVRYYEDINVAVAPGIVSRGKHMTLAPRKKETGDLRVEKYEFIAYDEEDAVDRDTVQAAVQYDLQCERALKQAIGQVPSNGPFKTLTNIDADGQILLRKLIDVQEKLKLDPTADRYMVTRDAFTESSNDIMGDHIYSGILSHERFIRPLLDVVLENVGKRDLNVVELNSTKTCLTDKWHKFLKSNGNLNYRLIHTLGDTLTSDSFNCELELVNWEDGVANMGNGFADLTIYQDVGRRVTPSDEPITEVDIGDLMAGCYAAVKDNGFLLLLVKEKLSRAEIAFKSLGFKETNGGHGVAELMEAATCAGFETIARRVENKSSSVAVLMRKIPATEKTVNMMHIGVDQYTWVDELKSKLKTADRVWLCGETGGIVGLVNCLRLEPGCDKVRCFLSSEVKEPTASILHKDLVMNVVKNGHVGSYRHISFREEDTVDRTTDAYLKIATPGDLSSFKWYEADFTDRPPSEPVFTVNYAPLNFRDVMLATGRLSSNDAVEKKTNIGIEVVGRDMNGNRIMGIVLGATLATKCVVSDSGFVWAIPASWTMEDAATVPIVYSTAYYALLIRGKLLPKESVLIHAGSGGVGLAAISICLSMKCVVYTTVGSQEKRDFIKKQFPQLDDEHIFNSRDTTFEMDVIEATDGHGVDVVLNSLSEDKLQASIRCLAWNGRFLEIGKYDMFKNNSLDLNRFHGNQSFQAIFLDLLEKRGDNLPKIALKHREKIHKMLDDGIAAGVVRPLPRTVFDKENVEDAFRYMATGKHVGKVIVKIRDENDRSSDSLGKSILTTTFDPAKVYIIVGGLGGFGLELADWMVSRGARRLMLTSRSGVKEPYQKYTLRRLRLAGAEVVVSSCDATSEDGAAQLVEQAREMGHIGGMFNLAMVLQDALFDNQTPESFEIVCRPKVDITRNLDKLLDHKVDYFVCFSSVSGGLGNVGQSNYGFGNSMMDLICEQRRQRGAHGLSIQWGVIGDVGILAGNAKTNESLAVVGYLPQRMPSCFAVLDQLLSCPHSVCSSMLKADAKQHGSSKKGSLIKRLIHIFGIKNINTVNPNVTLSELGMDSLMAIEMQQALEREYDLVLSVPELGKLKLSQLNELKVKEKAFSPGNTSAGGHVEMVLAIAETPVEAFVALNEVTEGKPIFFLAPMISGFVLQKRVAKFVDRPCIGLNWTREVSRHSTLEEVAGHFVGLIGQLEPDNDHHDIVGYSYGCAVAFEIAFQLAEAGRPPNSLSLLDGAPDHLQNKVAHFISNNSDKANKTSERNVTKLFLETMGDYLQVDNGMHETEILQLKSKTEMFERLATVLSELGEQTVKADAIAQLIEEMAIKIEMISNYTPNGMYGHQVLLIKAADDAELASGIAADYGLSKISAGQKIVSMKGNHMTFMIINSELIARTISQWTRGEI